MELASIESNEKVQFVRSLLDHFPCAHPANKTATIRIEILRIAIFTCAG